MAMAAACGATSTAVLNPRFQRRKGNSTRNFRFGECRAHRSGGSSSSSRNAREYYGYDLYKLLGVEDGAQPLEIKKAYRWLQKRCHPDVAGQLGHDMSILLNQAYDVLSDPNSRSSYDAVRSEWIHHEDFTGEPLYSKWMGPAGEEKAVFVDEIRCIGCLNCALIASNTFAVEKRFGRARAVSQWGDPKPVIDDAIRSCPVDCISWVDRRQLAALEYLMSKQPRFTANADPENKRALDVFRNADKFLKKNAQFQSQKQSRAAAVDAVQARAGRWWHFFVGKSYSSTEASAESRSSAGAIVKGNFRGAFGPSLFADSKLRALYEAVTQQKDPSSRAAGGEDEDYWEPLKHVDPSNSVSNMSSSFTAPVDNKTRAEEAAEQTTESSLTPSEEFLLRRIPVAASMAAALYVGLAGSVESHQSATMNVLIRQSVLLQHLFDSGLMQPLQAGVTWYVLTSLACGVIAITIRRFDSKT